MRKLHISFLVFFFIVLSAFSFRGRGRIVCGTWTAKIPIDNAVHYLHPSEYQYDTLCIKKNGTFVHYTYPVRALPHAIFGHWKIKADTLVLIPEFENYYFQTKNSGKRFRTKLNGTPNIKMYIDRIGNETYLYDNFNYTSYDKKQ